MIPLAFADGGYTIKIVDKHTLQVTKYDGKTYTINLQDKTCSCPSFLFQGIFPDFRCKHLQLIEDLEG